MSTSASVTWAAPVEVTARTGRRGSTDVHVALTRHLPMEVAEQIVAAITPRLASRLCDLSISRRVPDPLVATTPGRREAVEQELAILIRDHVRLVLTPDQACTVGWDLISPERCGGEQS